MGQVLIIFNILAPHGLVSLFKNQMLIIGSLLKLIPLLFADA